MGNNAEENIFEYNVCRHYYAPIQQQVVLKSDLDLIILFAKPYELAYSMTHESYPWFNLICV